MNVCVRIMKLQRRRYFRMKYKMQCLKDRIFTQLWTELEAKLKIKGIGFSKEWENEKAKEYFIETICIDEYYVSLATKEKISIEIEWFAGNGKEVK